MTATSTSIAKRVIAVASFAAVLFCVTTATSWGGVGPILLGDYNGDGFVDAEDAAVWANEYGSTGTFADGNGDFDVDQDDYDLMFDALGTTPSFLLAGGNLIGLASTALIYNSGTGDLSIDDTHAGGAVTSFFLTGLSAGDVPGMTFPYQRFVPGSPPGDTVGLVVDGSTSGVGQTDINLVGLPTTPFSFGNLLPPGLSLAEFETSFAGSFYLTDNSSSRESFTLFVTQIPEPSTGVLLVLAAGLWLGQRRLLAS